MISPCNECGGSGIIRWHTYTTDEAGPCPRCVDMPWLHIIALEPLVIEEMIQQDRTEFRPDPSTVMRWCRTHRCTASRLREDACRSAINGPYDDPEDCNIVWIERPTALAVVDA